MKIFLNRSIFSVILSITVLSSCASHNYTDSQRTQDRSISIQTNISNYRVLFPKIKDQRDLDKIKTSQSGQTTNIILPSLNRKYQTLTISSDDYNTDTIFIRKAPRIKAIGNDVLAGLFSFGLPFLVDPFRSDFYKVTNKSKTMNITLSYNQAFMTKEFERIKTSNSIEDYNGYLTKYPNSILFDYVRNKKDSLELNQAILKENEKAILDFIDSHPNSMYLEKAILIKNENEVAKSDFNIAINENTVEGYNSFIQNHPISLYTPEARRKIIDLAITKGITSTSLIEVKELFVKFIVPNQSVYQPGAYLEKINPLTNKAEALIDKEFYNLKAKDKYAMYVALWQKYTDMTSWFDIALIPSFPKMEQHKSEICSFLAGQIVATSTKEKQLLLCQKLKNDFKSFDINSNENIIAQTLFLSSSFSGTVKLFEVNFLKYYLDNVSERNGLKGIDYYSYKDSVVYALSQVDFEEITFVSGVINGSIKIKHNGTDVLLANVKSGIPSQVKYFDSSKLIVETNYTATYSYSYEYENGINMTLRKFENAIALANEAKQNGDFQKALKILKEDCKNDLPKELEINKKINQALISLDQDKWKYFAEKNLREGKKIIVGKEGYYGVYYKNGDNSYYEGIVDQDYISPNYDSKKIAIEHDLNGKIIAIKGRYKNTEIDFGNDYKNNPRLMITTFDNMNNKVMETLYEPTNKGVYYYKNGSQERQTQEKGTYNVVSLTEVEANKARQNYKGFHQDSLIKAENIIKIMSQLGSNFELNELNKVISTVSSKRDLTEAECSKLFDYFLIAKKNNLMNEATTLIVKYLECNGKGYNGTNFQYVASHYKQLKQYSQAIQYYKKWEASLLIEDFRGDLNSCYLLLSECYFAINDSKNGNYYKSKYEELEAKDKAKYSEKENDRGMWQSYCYSTLINNYKIKLEDNTKEVKYIMYNKSNVPVKIMTGTWMLRDEGIYGTAMMLTITWNGVNSNMPEMKFVAQYDGFGNLQGLIDSQNRTWNECDN